MTIFGSRTHQSPWASVSQLILLKFCQFWCIFGQKWGPYFIFLVLWINFSVIFHQFGCIPLAQRTQNAFRKSKPVFLDIWKKTSFFGLFVAIFLKIAVKSWIFPPKSCFIKKHMSFRSKIWNQIKKVIFRKFEIVPLLRHCGGGRTPNGKCHLKFPFWLFETFPYPKLNYALCPPSLVVGLFWAMPKRRTIFIREHVPSIQPK